MLYMPEMDFPHPERLAAWNAFYNGHIQMLLDIPGFLSAQRFYTERPTAAPYLAIYSLAHRDVLKDAPYRSKAGPTSTGEWGSLMTNWRRNLFDGLSRAPAVAADGWLAVMDRRSASSPPLPASYSALRPIDLDRSVVERGMIFGTATMRPPEPAEHHDWNVRVFKPMFDQLVPSPRTSSP